MLGVVPKVLWNRWYPADEKNRIRLETNCLLVETEGSRYLIESGTGNKLTEKERVFYGAAPGDWIGANLEPLGIPFDSIDLVALTHMHTDHIGGVVAVDPSGILFPVFKSAPVVVCRREYEDAEAGYGITPNAYDRHNWGVLEEMGLLQLADPGIEIAPRLRFLHTPGHTRGHQSILITGDNRSLLFAGDLIPLSRQAAPHFNMAFDVEPVVKAQTKMRILDEAARRDWLIVSSHDPDRPLCRSVYSEAKGRYELTAVDSA
jgi:glyoxylase-like metal-dependent hydrolase (beta-lactamase superfamily II)